MNKLKSALKSFLLYVCISILSLGIFIYLFCAIAEPDIKIPMIIMIIIFLIPDIICIVKVVKNKKAKKIKVAFNNDEKAVHCPHCGTSLPDNAVFCLKCGKKLFGTNINCATTVPGKDINNGATISNNITKPVSQQFEDKIKQTQSENKKQQQYIIHENTIEKVGGEITEDDIPYLIELSYQDILKQEENSTNPKFHRTDREEELAFNFSQKYAVQIKNLEQSFETPYREEQKTYNYKDKITLLELSLENFEKAKKWCYSKGKGGQIYFDDMWMNLNNSQTECFSYANLIQKRLDFIKTLAVIRQQILEIVNNAPGILQKELYGFFEADQKSDVVYALKDLVKDDCILKEKKGNSYSLTALVSQDIL